jgi:RNA polymerase sigma factor (sigma-70 family)
VLTPSAVVSDSDGDLRRLLAAGAPDAVSLLYQRYGSKMLAYARRYVADEGAAEDVVIDLLRRWLERPPAVHEIERLGAFLATSIYHAAIDWIRRDRAERGQPPRSDEHGLGRARSGGVLDLQSAEPAARDTLAARLANALAQLSNADRLLLESHYGHALTAEECMTLLGISRATFHQRLHRARTRLARLLTATDTVARPGEKSNAK